MMLRRFTLLAPLMCLLFETVACEGDNTAETRSSDEEAPCIPVDRPNDHDGDGLVDHDDNCPTVPNASQTRAAQLADTQRTDLTSRSEGDACAIKSIELGARHGCFLTYAGGMKCWGHNAHGQIATGDPYSRGKDTILLNDQLPWIDAGSSIKDMALGPNHTCIVLTNQKIKCWGKGDAGLLGDISDEKIGDHYGDDYSETITKAPAQEIRDETANETVIDITAGENTTCMLIHNENNEENRIKCFNDEGVAIVIEQAPTTIDRIDLRNQHICAWSSTETNNSSVRCWGVNSEGQLGTNSRDDKDVPTVLSAHSMNSIAQIITGRSASTCAIYGDGKMGCWGSNANGILGRDNDNSGVGYEDGDYSMENIIQITFEAEGTTRVLQASIGSEHVCSIYDHTVATSTLRKVKCWGRNENFRTWPNQSTDNIGDDENRSIQDAISLDASMLDGMMPVQIKTGDGFTCLLRNDNRIHCWGSNNEAQLGVGSKRDREPTLMLQYVKTGLNPALPHDEDDLDTDGIPYVCDNCPTVYNPDQSQAMQAQDTSRTELPQLGLGDACAIKKVDANREQACVLLYSGALKCWGNKDNGALTYLAEDHIGLHPEHMGINLPFVNTGDPVRDIALGHDHTCAVFYNGKIKCWGENNDYALGQLNPQQSDIHDDNNFGDNPYDFVSQLGWIEIRSEPRHQRVSSIAAGELATCATVQDTRSGYSNYVTCWGTQDEGILGRGFDHDVSGMFATTLPLAFISENVDHVHLKRRHAYAWSSSTQSADDIACWGRNDDSILARKTFRSIPGMPEFNVPLDDVEKIVTGYSHTCGIYDQGKIACWGHDDHGKLGDDNNETSWRDDDEFVLIPVILEGEGTTRVWDAALTNDATCAIYEHTTGNATQKKIKCWGSNSDERSYPLSSDKKYGEESSAPVRDAPSLTFTNIIGDVDPIHIAAGERHYCVLRADNHISCWGDNNNGSLGLGADFDFLRHIPYLTLDLGLR